MKNQATKKKLNRQAPFFVIIVLLSACSFSPSSDESPLMVTSNFARSFVTDDTTLFYSTVEIDSVVNYINNNIKYHRDRSYSIYDVRIILFFRFAPWKITPEGLQARKDHPFPFSYFELDSITRNEGTIRTTLQWSVMRSDYRNSLILTLFEKDPGVWKIKAIDFPADSITSHNNVK